MNNVETTDFETTGFEISDLETDDLEPASSEAADFGAVDFETVDSEAINTEVMECAQCEGEGHVLHLGAASIFSGSAEAYLPAEGYMLCPLCYGEGEIEVCCQCREPFEIVGGREVCACAVLELPKAA